FGDAAEGAGYPLPDEPFVAAWEGYAADAARVGVLEALRARLPQLSFPVAAGMSETEAYRAATRRGEWAAAPGVGVRLSRPRELRLLLHPTPAGRIPVLIAGARDDFEALVRAFTRRNEPEPIPASMGAAMVGGYNNWDRVRQLRAAWEAEHGPAGWPAAFRETIVPRKELYQDRFVILGRGAYSATPAAEMGMDAGEWDEISLRIRLEHECAHYFTRRVLGSMKNALHDELIADSTGMMSATGEFSAEWQLRFLGLEEFPAYRAGGRLENYRGTPPLSDAAFAVLQSLVVAAVRNLEEVSAGVAARRDGLAWRAGWVLRLAAQPLEALAAPARFSPAGPLMTS
ncbi:MAG TPA: hypothetical protein VK420_11925, partial [Longimicrobium sp.]|nr:hypothetical protein [Longimicrobium sp.]